MKKFITVLFVLSYSFSFAIKDSIVLQLKWKHQFQFAGYYMAKEKGFYDAANLNVNIKVGSEYCNPIDSVLKNKAHFGIGGSDLLIERNNGKPIVVLLSIYQHSPLVLISKNIPKINNIHDIIGKRVMIENNSSELYAYLKNEGININTIIQYPFKENVLNLINDSVDFISAYISDEPYFLDKNKIAFQIFKPQSAGIDFYSDVLFTNYELTKSNSKIVDAFILATKKGWEYALSNTDETINIIFNNYSNEKGIEYLKFEAEESKQLIRNDIVEIGYMFEGRWRHIGETFVELGMLKNNFKTDNFIYSSNIKKSKFNLLYYSLSGFLILSCIILPIMISYFIYKHLDFKRTKKSKTNGQKN